MNHVASPHPELRVIRPPVPRPGEATLFATHVSPEAGQRPPLSALIDFAQLVAAYYAEVPDPSVPAQRVRFGTSGHRGSAFDVSFNEWHVLAIAQAICHCRKVRGVNGPLFLGIDTHALSRPASASLMEVLAANGVDVMLALDDAYTPTPAVSHAILAHNRGRKLGLADGIVVTPSHNPPRDGGIKYNSPNGGPAGTDITDWIEAAANQLLESRLQGVRRVSAEKSLRAATTHRHDFRAAYVADLANVIDMSAIASAGLRMAVDPMGGAGVDYWPVIAERYHLDLTLVHDTVDPTFRFMPLDWDGQIRMDPASPFAMQSLIATKDQFDIGFACDTDHDRHGIVTASAGLLSPNHYLPVAIEYLFQRRSLWGAHTGIGKSVVTTGLIDRLAARLGRRLFEVPVGFKWFGTQLQEGLLGFAGEESAGATFLRIDSSVWTTDKDGIAAALLSAEITARTGQDLDILYSRLAGEFGDPVAERVEAPATAAQNRRLAALAATQIKATQLAGERIESVLNAAPGNDEPIGGVKVTSASGWFAARPSGTEPVYRIYAESFRGHAHLRRILEEAQAIVNLAITPSRASRAPLRAAASVR